MLGCPHVLAFKSLSEANTQYANQTIINLQMLAALPVLDMSVKVSEQLHAQDNDEGVIDYLIINEENTNTQTDCPF